MYLACVSQIGQQWVHLHSTDYMHNIFFSYQNYLIWQICKMLSLTWLSWGPGPSAQSPAGRWLSETTEESATLAALECPSLWGREWPRSNPVKQKIKYGLRKLNKQLAIKIQIHVWRFKRVYSTYFIWLSFTCNLLIGRMPQHTPRHCKGSVGVLLTWRSCLNGLGHQTIQTFLH